MISKLSNMEEIRNGFGRAMVQLGQSKQVVALCADVEQSVRLDAFAKKYPDQYFEVGVAEQNLIGIASGMALEGLIPFAASYAAFVPGRSFDQIRISIAYNQANVKLVGSHAGLTVGPDGATHQMLEDIALMQSLPNLTVIVPADAREAYNATISAASHRGPVYLRLSRAKVPIITNDDFKIGKSNCLKGGDDIAIIACGTLVHEALMAAAKLIQEGIETAVINCSTIKPLDRETILKIIKPVRGIVVAEEAQAEGGLGSTVAMLVCKYNPKPMRFISVKGKFGRSGNAEELMRKYELTSQKIIEESLNIFQGGNC